jgi:type II secretory pathway pseudopilin PulG
MEAHAGLGAAAAATAYGGLIARASDEHEARARKAQAQHDQYLDEARRRGITAEDAEKILTAARDNWPLVGEPYQFATAALAVFAPAPETKGFTAPKDGWYQYSSALEDLDLPDGSITTLPNEAWSIRDTTSEKDKA